MTGTALAAPPKVPWTWGTALFDRALHTALWNERDLVRGHVVDLGCGMQPYRDWLGGNATRWTGLDLPSTASGRSLADIFATAGAAPLRSALADTVISTQVIEHMARPQELFAEAARLLKPGGTLLVSAPQSQWLHEEPHDYWRFTRYGLMELARAAGLEPLRVVPLGGAIALLGWVMATHVPMLGARERSPWWHVRRTIQAAVQIVAAAGDRLMFQPNDPIGNLLVAARRT